MTTYDDVLRVHAENPEWTAPKIAAELGCLREYVVATARRKNIVLPLTLPKQNDPKILRAQARELIHRAEKKLTRAQAIEREALTLPERVALDGGLV